MQYVLDFFSALFAAILCVFLFRNKFEIKKEKMPFRLSSIVLILLLKEGIVLLQIPPLNLIAGFFMVFYVIWILFQVNKSAWILYSVILTMIFFGCDALGVIVCSFVHENTITTTLGTSSLVWQHHLWNWTFQVIFIRIIELIINREKQIKIKWNEVVFYALLIIFEIVIFAYVSSIVQTQSSGSFMIIMICGFLILDVYLMYMFYRISNYRSAEYRMNLLQQQEQLQLQMYQELQSRYKMTCSIAHDMNRHINALKELFVSNEDHRVEKYLFDLAKETERLKPMIRNSNPMLEIILNTAAVRCEKLEIDFVIEVEDFEIKTISDIDITTIFSNLLDNAIDACEEVSQGDRKISVVLCRKIGLIALRITNSCNTLEDAKIKWGNSTKEGHSGIGLKNVQIAAEKYGGTVTVSAKQGEFQTSVTISIADSVV